MANCPSLLLVKQMNCIVTLVRSRRLRYCSRGLRQFTVSLSVLAHPQMPVALRDPFRGGEDIFASSRLETTNVDRQIELPRVPDEGMQMVLCQGAHVSLKPPVREENSKAFGRAPGNNNMLR